MENLCFMLEAMQFKQQLISNLDELLNDKMECDHEECGWIIRLPDFLPKSSIIQKEDNFEQQIVALYNKYISNEADLCINISYEARRIFVTDLEYIVAANEQRKPEDNEDEKESASTATKQSETGDSYNTEIRHRMIKIFDTALMDINTNLSCSFVRFQLYGNFDATPQDIIDVMMKETK